MLPYKHRRIKKEVPDFIQYLKIGAFSNVGIAFISLLITGHIFFVMALIGGIVVFGVIYYMTREYDVINLQSSFREGGEFDMSLYLIQHAEVEKAKFGVFPKKNVNLRIEVLEGDYKVESSMKQKKEILKELKRICKFFDFKEKYKVYDKKLRALNKETKGMEEKKGEEEKKEEETEQEEKKEEEAQIDHANMKEIHIKEV